MTDTASESIIRVLIADDHQIVRSGLRQMIAGQSDMKLVAECKTGREVIDQMRADPVDVLLLDLSLPDMSGLDVLRQIRSHHEKVAVLVVSGYPESQFGLNVLRAGDSFGEVELLEGAPRPTTVRASTDVIALRLDGSDRDTPGPRARSRRGTPDRRSEAGS